MPNSRPIDTLRGRLQAELAPGRIFRAPIWGNPHSMTEALRVLKRDLGSSDGGPPSGDVLQASLQNFAKTQEVGTFTELKYVCYGVTVPVGGAEWRVIDRTPLFDKLLSLVQQRQNQPKQFRRCYQGLLSGYFGFERHRPQEGSGPLNWAKLQGFLNERLRHLLLATARRGVTPEWLPLLDSHRNLFSADPCARYADGLARGDANELKTVCAGLGIPGTSWVWDDALMAYVRAVCKSEDRAFHAGLSGVLKLVNGRADFKLAETLATKATAMTVERYAHCGDKPEHPELRDTSLQLIGNPWLKRTAWDAHVNHEPARQMVEGWLKRRLIKDFFELLAQDGGADLRRLDYWLNWEPQITDMWFVLGSDARHNSSSPFVELRKRMAGRDRILTDNNQQNNAFVMRIGPLLVIEFGVKGNACYIFAASDFRTNLETRTLGIHDLKQRAHATRLSHMAQWEGKFDYDLRRLLQSVPQSKGHLDPVAPKVQSQIKPMAFGGSPSWMPPPREPRHEPQEPALTASSSPPSRKSFTPDDFETIRRLCAQRGIAIEDKRPQGGPLRVLMTHHSKHLGLAMALEGYGFKLVANKGYSLTSED